MYIQDWSLIGFQGKNPATDFRGMGLLGLLQVGKRYVYIYIYVTWRGHFCRWLGDVCALGCLVWSYGIALSFIPFSAPYLITITLTTKRPVCDINMFLLTLLSPQHTYIYYTHIYTPIHTRTPLYIHIHTLTVAWVLRTPQHGGCAQGAAGG